MKEEIKFQVYRYDFENGGVYIGRTRNDQRRFNVIKAYEGQYVHKIMTTENFRAEIVLETSNPLIVYDIEHTLISYYYDRTDCYNCATEEDWQATVFKDIASKKLDYNLDDLHDDIEEYRNEISRIRERILSEAKARDSQD